MPVEAATCGHAPPDVVERCERNGRRVWKEHNGKDFTQPHNGVAMLSWMCEAPDYAIEAKIAQQRAVRQMPPTTRTPDFWKWCRPDAGDMYKLKYPDSLSNTITPGQYRPDMAPARLGMSRKTGRLPKMSSRRSRSKH